MRPDPAGLLRTLRTLGGAGALRPVRPDRLLGAAVALRLWGVGPAGGYAANALRWPDAPALVDPAGALTWADVDARAAAVGAGLTARGIGPGDRLGVLCDNDRYFVLAVTAAGRAGADAVLLNTGLAAPRLAEVVEREALAAVVAAPAYADLVPAGVPVLLAGDLDRLAREYAGRQPRPPRQPGRIVVLTSGTTGAPKGAHRDLSAGVLGPVVGLLDAIPFRAGEPTVVAAPLFHAWGLSNWLIGLFLGSTLVLTGRFDPERTLAAVARSRATALVAVPVMLRRLLDLPAATRRRYDTRSLRVVAVSGSALPPDLARRFAAEYGDVLYNLYGSTEVAYATVAGPGDLRLAPGTAGRPLAGTRVAVLTSAGTPAGAGEVGRVFVGSGLRFEGYTGGGGREAQDGMLATGDLGRWDEHGLLHLVGREDDMVVSGGENVFPQPVELCIAELPSVAEVVVVGVPDPEWGQRLRAVVVPVAGARVDADEVRAHVKARLARHEVPRDVVVVAALPRNAAGKVLRRELS